MRYGQTGRYNGKCKCGAGFSAWLTLIQAPGVLSSWWCAFQADDGTTYPPSTIDQSAVRYECPACGTPRIARRVVGKYHVGKACSAKCLSATGHQCECQCAGKNHGASHEAVAS